MQKLCDFTIKDFGGGGGARSGAGGARGDDWCGCGARAGAGGVGGRTSAFERRVSGGTITTASEDTTVHFS